jgi:hypothetical protein
MVQTQKPQKVVVVDPSSGLVIPVDEPARVLFPDGLLVSQSLSVIGTFFEQDWDDYDGCDLEITTYQTGATISATWSTDQVTYNNMTGDLASGTQNASASSTFTGTGAFLFRKQGKFLKLTLTGTFTGSVSIKAFFRKGTFNGVVTVRGNSQTGQNRLGAPVYIGLKDAGGLGRDWTGDASGYGGVFIAPETSGGLSISRVRAATSGVVKASIGQLYGWSNLINTTASIRYLQIYNKATVGIPGTDTPTFTIPFLANGGGAAFSSDIGIAFATGISWAITTDEAGATVGTSGDIIGSLFYK